MRKSFVGILAIASMVLMAPSVSPFIKSSFCSLDANNDGVCEQVSADHTQSISWQGSRPPSGFILVIDTTTLGAEMASGTEVTFDQIAAADDEIIRTTGDWTAEGFTAGMTVVVSGSTSNNITFLIDSLDALKLYIAGDTVTDEAASSTESISNNTAQTLDVDIQFPDAVGNLVTMDSLTQIAAKGTVRYYFGDAAAFDSTNLTGEISLVTPSQFILNMNLGIADVVVYEVGIIPLPAF